MISVHIYKVRQLPTPELFTFPDGTLLLNEGKTKEIHSSQIQYSGGRNSAVKYGFLL